MEFRKAERLQRKARIDLTGPSGSGKTYTALSIASGLGDKIGVIDSERNSASLFADEFEFDALSLPDLQLETYFKAMEAAKDFDVVIIDSLSHAWDAVNEEVTNFSKRSQSGNSFKAWGEKGNPLYNKLLEKLLTMPCHVIVTMRVKSDYVMEEYTDRSGAKKTRPMKVGLAPKFREGGEYEFDLVANLDLDHNLVVEKTRMTFLDGKVINKPTAELGIEIRKWLESGKAVEQSKPATASKAKAANGKADIPPEVKEVFKGAKVEVVIPSNPWLWKLEGESQHKDKLVCGLPDEVIEALKAKGAIEALEKKGKLTMRDGYVLKACFEDEEKKIAALASLSLGAEGNELQEGETENGDEI